MRSGVRLGIDVGTVRIGIARSDRDGLLAVPVTTIARGEHHISEIAEIANEADAIEILLGLPLSLAGDMTASTHDALSVAYALVAEVDIPIRCVDERLTTVSAHSALRRSGKKQKDTKQIIDQVAAVMILQHALDSERSTGKPAGKELSEFPATS